MKLLALTIELFRSFFGFPSSIWSIGFTNFPLFDNISILFLMISFLGWSSVETRLNWLKFLTDSASFKVLLLISSRVCLSWLSSSRVILKSSSVKLSPLLRCLKIEMTLSKFAITDSSGNGIDKFWSESWLWKEIDLLMFQEIWWKFYLPHGRLAMGSATRVEEKI